MKIKRSKLSLPLRAELALQSAVAKVIVDHRHTGDPIVVWRNGKAILISASDVKISRKTTRRHSKNK